MEQPFRSAIELDNQHDSRSGSGDIQSNAFTSANHNLATSSGSSSGGDGRCQRKTNDITSYNSNVELAPLPPLSQSSFNLTQVAGAAKHTNHRHRRSRYTQCPQREDQETAIMKLKTNDSSKKLQKKNRKLEARKRKPHFRIDWRQLSYHQRPHSFLSKCLANLDVFGPCNSKTMMMQQDHQQAGQDPEVSSLATADGSANQPKRILNSLDGCFKSGELSAILGPSGAGKSTFLSTLFGAKQDTATGYTKVTWLNNESVANSSGLVTTVSSGSSGDNQQSKTGGYYEDEDENEDERLRSLRIAFLPQHDHLLHHLTVYETLMFASKIKNHDRAAGQDNSDNNNNSNKEGGQTSANNNNRRNFHHMNVKRVAKMLKLTDCLNTRCGKLSGGQYKRVSIGQELLSEPDVIILDEPTSGLDAMTCLTTVQTLKSIVTKHPMSIILTIHQPDNDVFSLFDKVYVIAQGGIAIYEGPPDGIFPALAQVNLIPPRANYNPARFIVENAFVPEPGVQDDVLQALALASPTTATGTAFSDSEDTTTAISSSSSSSDSEDSDAGELDKLKTRSNSGYFRRSVQSLTDTIMGKEMPFVDGSIRAISPAFNKRDTISRRPLLNLGIRTLDGQLITGEQLALMKRRDTISQQQQERIQLLRLLNQMQKAKYERPPQTGSDQSEVLQPKGTQASSNTRQSSSSSGRNSPTVSSPSPNSTADNSRSKGGPPSSARESSLSAKSDYSSASACSMTMLSGGERKSPHTYDSDETSSKRTRAAPKSLSLACLPAAGFSVPSAVAIGAAPTSKSGGLLHIDTAGSDHHDGLGPGQIGRHETKSADSKGGEFVVDFSAEHQTTDRRKTVMRRKFDKRLSAKHNCSHQTGYPILYHAMILTHRTWLSIVRDPIFFGIQACMHTLIPIVLASIFGSVQEEGCPRIGSFDLVDFAYSDSDNLIQQTVRSIRQSIGNIGIVFFEMFVICFAINCITALVFPLDMYVLLKEYRNGWYSLRSYFMGRTLADLPVPVVLHSIGMAILCFMTGQPLSWWRFGTLLLLVILASLVAQSVGLTIGAVLMKSSQSAVLAAAGIVAPFFALSGFIVRIHTLPVVARAAAQLSYLYHLLNGFIVLRYGFDRCACSEEQFEQNAAHQIPSNLHTMASMWIGTYSDEYSNSSSVMRAASSSNRSNVDPNIDVVDKMMTAFKMANSYGHQIDNCQDVLPYAMLDFNQRDQDIYYCFYALLIMLVITRLITFSAIYYKIRSFA